MRSDARATTIPAMLSALAKRRPDAAAFVYRGAETSFAELSEMSRAIAAGFADCGVRRGDRVALWLPNTPFWFAAFAACCRLGAVAVAVNTRFRAAEVEDVLHRSGAKVLVTWPGFRGIDFEGILADVPDRALGALATVVRYGEGGEPRSAAAGRWRVIGHDDLMRSGGETADASDPGSGCIVFTTSGTTSAPKLVLHSQGGIARHAQDVARDFGLDAPDTAGLLALPACGVFGFCQAMATLAAGRPTVLMPAFDADEALALIEGRRVTHLNGSDDMLRRLLSGDRTGVLARNLRLAGFAAFNAGVEDLVAACVRDAIPLVGLYGMSEVQALFARRSIGDPPERRFAAGGHPVSAAARVRVRDPETGVLLGAGETGEIEIDCPGAMIRYLYDDAATRAAMTEDGYFRTGDLGYLASDGSFAFLARMGDAMRLGGYLVSPAEIEAEIGKNPAVAECYAVAAEIDGRARAVVFARPAPGHAIDETALIRDCGFRLAAFKVPARIVSTASFPMADGANGNKIQRAELRRQAARIARL